MRKRFVGVITAICMLAIAVYVFLCFRSAMRTLSNADYVAGVDYAICQFLNGQKESVTNNLIRYIENNFHNIKIEEGQIIDKNNRPMKVIIHDNTNTFYIIVSSSGKDGVWGTKDDLKREGFLEKTSQMMFDEASQAYGQNPDSGAKGKDCECPKK